MCIRDRVYADTSNQIGFLNNGEGWSLRANSSNNVFVHGTDLTINADGAGSSNINMNDGDEGNRIIHCNSNRIGFLTQAGSWGAYCDDSGNWAAANFSGSSSGTNTGDQTNISGYSQLLYFSGSSGKAIMDGLWAGGGAYPGYQFTGGNSRFGFSSTSGVVDVYADGNFYATDSSHLVLHAGNYNSYSPTLTGGNASGTWGINVTGSAGSVAWTNVSSRPTALSQFSNDLGNYGGWALTSHLHDDRYFFNRGFTSPYPGEDANAMTENRAAFTYSNNAPLTGCIAYFPASGYGIQLNGDYQGDSFSMRSRNGDAGTWRPWKRLLTDYNYNSYSPTLTGTGASGTWVINVTGNATTATTAARATRANGNFYIDDNYGNGIVGVYTSTRLQGVFAMGDSYKLPADGTSASNLYGMAWSHPNAGGVAANLNTHGLLVMENGTFLAAISGSIRARDDMRAPAIYDSGSRVAISRGEGRDYVNYSRYVYNNGAYSGTGWIEPSDLGVRYANTAGSAPANGGTATALNSSNYISQRGSNGSWNADFQATPAGTMSYGGDLGANGTNGPGGSWWIQENFRHTNSSNYWGTQVAWGWEDNANRLATRNVTGGNYGSWVYYLNSGNVTSYMDAPNKAGTSYYQVNTWLQMNGTHGIYYPSYNGAHFYVNTTTSYTQFRLDGSRGGYGGIWDSYSSVHGIMYDSAGNGGVYREANGRWYWYHHLGNNCTALATSTTSSSYRAYVGGALYAEGDIVAFSDVRKKTDIVTIDNALHKVINLRGVYYTRIDDPLRGRQTGVIAQEINEVLPEVVTYAADVDHYGVSYGNIVGVLIEAIKEQQTQIEDLKLEIKKLRGE